METFIRIFLMFIIYSFIGWVAESIYVFIINKKITSRGFLIGPICPIYGVGSILIVMLLSPLKPYPLLLFTLSVAICSILEYLTSYMLEKMFNARWWDYSNSKYHVNGRICLKTMTLFGLGGIGITYLVHPIIKKMLDIIPKQLSIILTIILLIVFIVDLALSTRVIINLKSKLNHAIKDNTEEIKEKVKEIMKNNYLTKRLMKSFPDIKNTIKNRLENIPKINIKRNDK